MNPIDEEVRMLRYLETEAGITLKRLAMIQEVKGGEREKVLPLVVSVIESGCDPTIRDILFTAFHHSGASAYLPKLREWYLLVAGQSSYAQEVLTANMINNSNPRQHVEVALFFLSSPQLLGIAGLTFTLKVAKRHASIRQKIRDLSHAALLPSYIVLCVRNSRPDLIEIIDGPVLSDLADREPSAGRTLIRHAGSQSGANRLHRRRKP